MGKSAQIGEKLKGMAGTETAIGSTSVNTQLSSVFDPCERLSGVALHLSCPAYTDYELHLLFICRVLCIFNGFSRSFIGGVHLATADTNPTPLTIPLAQDLSIQKYLMSSSVLLRLLSAYCRKA